MQVSLANDPLRSLKELGRRRGQLSAADLQEFLPIEAMSHDEIAQVISELENQGIEITVDPDLLVPRPSSLPRSPPRVAQAADPMRAAGMRWKPNRALEVVRPPEKEPRPGKLEVLSLVLAGFIACAVAIVLVWTLG